MPSETVSEGIAFVPPFLHHGQCGPVDSSPRFSSPKKKRLFRHQRGTAAKPLQYPSRLPFRASPRKPKNPVDSSPRFSSPKKKTVFLQSTGTAANPLQYPSRFLFRASPRKPKNPVDSSFRFSSPKKNGFPAINRHGGKPVAIPVQTSPPCLSPQAAKSG